MYKESDRPVDSWIGETEKAPTRTINWVEKEKSISKSIYF